MAFSRDAVYLETFLSIRFHFSSRSNQGTEHSVTTGRFQEAKLHWPLSGNESWKATVASVPSKASQFENA
jgi:hypothetical protein